MNRFRKQHLLATVVILLGAGSNAAAEQQLFPVDFSRAARVGDLHGMTVEASRTFHQKAVRKSRVIRDETIREEVRLDTVLEVLETAPSGSILEIRYVVTRFSGRSAGKEIGRLARGDEIVARRGNGKTLFYINGKKPRKNVRALLELALPLPASDAADDYGYFGSEQPQPVGGQWPVNRELAARLLTRDRIRTNPEAIQGDVTLAAVEKVEGARYLHVRGALEANPVVIEGPVMTKDATARVTLSFTGKFPIEEGLPPLETAHELRIEADIAGSGVLRGVRVALSDDRQVRKQYRPLEALTLRSSVDGAGQP